MMIVIGKLNRLLKLGLPGCLHRQKEERASSGAMPHCGIDQLEGISFQRPQQTNLPKS
jgi:hypothetical protein